MTTTDDIKISYALRLLSRFVRIKEKELMCDFTVKVGECDFTVKVGEKSFPVHRAVLIASSDYFEGMFSSNMKEVREGFVEMMNVGTTKITMESVQEILHVTDLLQLDDLKNLSFLFLLERLSAKNCLSVISLSQTYHRQDVEEKAELVLISDMEAVILSEMFPLINRSDLLRYLSKVDYLTSWKAAIAWIKDKEGLPQLIESMDIKKFPFKFLLETVLEEPLVKKSEHAINLAIDALFSSVETLEVNLDSANCVDLKILSQNRRVDDEISDVFNRFMKKNFEVIALMDEFGQISKDDVIGLFESTETKYSSETVKWEVALKWVKHDIQNKKEVFPELFRLIKFKDLSLFFLNNTVQHENLVKKCENCTTFLLSALISKATLLETENSDLQKRLEVAENKQDSDASDEKIGALGGVPIRDCEENLLPTIPSSVLDNILADYKTQPANGMMSSRVLDERLSGQDSSKTTEITYTFNSGNLEGISYPSQTFTAYLPDRDLRLFIKLQKAFNSGQIFKLCCTGQRQGLIVWGDIPHKTSKRGGVSSNGYPDASYLSRLKRILHDYGY